MNFLESLDVTGIAAFAMTLRQHCQPVNPDHEATFGEFAAKVGEQFDRFGMSITNMSDHVNTWCLENM